ncbi:hypothetical protein EYZ11_002666 [Aspergillus tanneri]|uniref:Ketoreductase domain-containing protein n=1 Tax=Aspergillus tanneri TaxID=1220188 RepID=A0A4S3JQB2_9EURO|nr:uncharacterized protein ATNIH1004_002295 [Aspergillus tanneri]KAA8649624.1 hypothetical protein ATNIH1004_002295 [Aspergillus tanneri]THC97866.1 hypothetical protein EYZ11_002666 [Aspergillus tanneri]
MTPSTIEETLESKPRLNVAEQSDHLPPSVPDLLLLRGKTIAITGGGRGLGMAFAFAVVESGGHVACLDILLSPSEPEWSNLLDMCKKSGVTVTYNRCDITNETELTKILENIAQVADDKDAPFSGIVACAGIQQKVPALEYDPQDFERILRVNVTGAFLTAKRAARILVERKRGGSIVLIASMSGQIANRGLTCTAYNTRKSAVHQMCRSLAQEWGQYGIRINTLSPGYIRTEMTKELIAAEPEVEKTWMAGALLERLATPDEFKAPAVFLLSEGSSFMTGADLRVDGGHCASA